MTLRVRLLLLLALAILPAVVLAIINTLNRHEQDVSQARHTVRTLSLVASSRHREALAATEAMLAVLARVPEVREGEPERCSLTLSRVLEQFAGRYSNLSVLDETGRVVCSVLPVPGERSYADRGFFRDARDSRKFSVSGFVTGELSREPIIVAAYPLTDSDGSFAGIVATGLSLYWFTSLADIFALPVGSTILIVDNKGTAYAFDDASLERLPRQQRLMEALETREQEFDAIGRNGARYLYSVTALDSDRLFALSLVPLEVTLDQASTEVLIRVAEILAFCLFAVLAVWVGAYFLVLKPLRSFYSAAAAYREGDFSYRAASAEQPPEIRDLAQKFFEMAQGIQAREERLQALIDQRELLVQEIHHRVKNNLQIVSSLLSLQAKRIKVPAARREFEVARERVNALALLHRHLYEQREADSIGVRTFITHLVRQLVEAYQPRDDGKIESAVDIDDIRVPPSVVVPLGLIIAEALSNSLKHAFPTGGDGRIEVFFHVDHGRGKLVVRDNGIAGPPIDESDTGLGRTLMQAFAAQLEGEIEVTSDGGTVVTVSFPLNGGARDQDTRAG